MKRFFLAADSTMHTFAVNAAMLQWLLLSSVVLGTPDGALNLSNCGLRENYVELEDETITSLQASFLQTEGILNRASQLTHINGTNVTRPSFGVLFQPLDDHRREGFTAFAFILFVVLFLLARRTIEEYEATAHPLMPPWYMDPSTMLKVGGGCLFVWWVIGMIGFSTVFLFDVAPAPRHLTLPESFYLCAQIVTTVGYGDIVPATPQGQVFIVMYVLLGVIEMATFLTALVSTEMSSLASNWTWMATKNKELLKLVYRSDHDESAFGNFFLSLVPVVLLAVAGIIFFTSYPGENLTLFEALYMTCMTFTTVGFGAIHPLTDGGHWFGACWMMAGVLAMGNVCCCFGDAVMKKTKALKTEAVTTELLKGMDADGDAKVDKFEFLKFELIRRGFCDGKDFDGIMNNFASIDADGSGELSVEDLKLLLE